MAEPCTVEVTSNEKGGMTVTLIVPTYETESARFTLQAERDNEGDWRIYIPWPGPEDDWWDEGGSLFAKLPSGEEVSGGILYLGAPETEEG